MKTGLMLGTCATVAACILGNMRGANETLPSPAPAFRQYCYQCHGNGAAMAGISLDKLVSQASVGDSFEQWEKVAAALEQDRMPPKGRPDRRGLAIRFAACCVVMI